MWNHGVRIFKKKTKFKLNAGAILLLFAYQLAVSFSFKVNAFVVAFKCNLFAGVSFRSVYKIYFMHRTWQLVAPTLFVWKANSKPKWRFLVNCVLSAPTDEPLYSSATSLHARRIKSIARISNYIYRQLQRAHTHTAIYKHK